MKESLGFYPFEKGQILPLVALMMFVIIGMVALILDGGAIIANRRSAQAAADAGALAGAQAICMNVSNPQGVAVDYATRNGATSVTAVASGKLMTVDAAVEYEGVFFSRILGGENLNASAHAVAGCYYPSFAKRVLPIAFFYEDAPANAQDEECYSDGICNLVNWDLEELMEKLDDEPVVNPTNYYLNHPFDDIYVVADSTKVCEKDDYGVIVCSDMAANASGGNRSFLELGIQLQKAISDGIPEPIVTPAWVNGEPGVVESFFGLDFSVGDPIPGYEDLPARLFFVPVFDEYCPIDPRNDPTCTYDLGDNFPDFYKSQQKSYRLIGYAPFVLTCSTKVGDCAFGDCVNRTDCDANGICKVKIKVGENVVVKEVEIGNKPMCPGYLTLKTQLEADPTYDMKDFPTEGIEGYFVGDIMSDEWVWGTEGVDVGIYEISLTE